jgi:hypothetical protein
MCGYVILGMFVLLLLLVIVVVVMVATAILWFICCIDQHLAWHLDLTSR